MLRRAVVVLLGLMLLSNPLHIAREPASAQPAPAGKVWDMTLTAAAEPKSPDGDVVVRIDSEIEGMMALHIGETVEQAKKDNAKHITVRINSPGGEVLVGMDIIRILRESNIPTTCVVDDVAASMAAIIFESPACGERVVHAQSIIMFHGISGDSRGNQRDAENKVSAMRAINQWAAEVICSRTHWSVRKYIQHVITESRELWLVGRQAVRKHAADRVLPVESPERSFRLF